MNTEIQKYCERNDLVVLPDNEQWKNRFEIRSESSNRIYIIAQNKSTNNFGCSCPGWRVAKNGIRSCKHLAALKPLLNSVNTKQIK